MCLTPLDHSASGGTKGHFPGATTISMIPNAWHFHTRHLAEKGSTTTVFGPQTFPPFEMTDSWTTKTPLVLILQSEQRLPFIKLPIFRSAMTRKNGGVKLLLTSSRNARFESFVGFRLYRYVTLRQFLVNHRTIGVRIGCSLPFEAYQLLSLVVNLLKRLHNINLAANIWSVCATTLQPIETCT